MKTETVAVVDRLGHVMQGQLLVCPECNAVRFNLLVVEGRLHLICLDCHRTFCGHEGACGREPDDSFYEKTKIQTGSSPVGEAHC